MKIALCLEYPIDQHGGTEVLVRELIQGLAHEHQILLVSGDSSESAKASSVGQFLSGHLAWNPLFVSVKRSKELAEAIAQEGVQLAHFHFGGTYSWGSRFPRNCPITHLGRLGVRCVSTVHLVVDLLEGYCGQHRPAWFKALMFPLVWCGKAQQLRHTRHEIAVSQHDFRKLRRWYRSCRSRFVQIYHSRLNESALTGEPVVRQPVILNVGHVAWRKGQAVLAEAFARVAPQFPEWKLQLAGLQMEDRATLAIKRVAREHRLEERILLLGERNDALDLMQRAAIYVQPSFWEALGLALQEAMFYGCPAIGSRAGGIPELIEDGKTGILVEAGNVQQLSAALEQLMRDPVERELRGKAAAASIREKGMTVAAMIKRHLELYDTAIRNI